MDSRGHRRAARAARHLDLSVARQRPTRGVPRRRGRQTGDPRPRAGRRFRAAGGAGFSSRRLDLVCRRGGAPRAMTDRDELKRAAALRAIEEVADGMVVGLGTGSTAAFVVEGLGAKVAAGLRLVGIPTSERTAAYARRLGIPISTFAEHQRLDLTIDGADEVQ